MEYNRLGETDLIVSKLCFGGLTIGPLQADLTDEEGASVILSAFQRGVNFIDTADLYKTYSHIRTALQQWDRDKVIICSKSYAWDRQSAQETLNRALDQLETDYIDLFMMHEQESEHTFRGHREALDYFLEKKSEGVIKHIGLSTHYVAGVEVAIANREIEVVHPIVNKKGLGIQDGTIDDMIDALQRYKARGGGVFAMKPLGGGNLLGGIDEAFDYVLGLDVVDSIAVGMQRESEVIANVNRFSGKPIPADVQASLRSEPRKLHIDTWCTACGACVKKCGLGALEVVDGRARVDRDKCVLCGYCSAVCPEFCIKVV